MHCVVGLMLQSYFMSESGTNGDILACMVWLSRLEEFLKIVMFNIEVNLYKTYFSYIVTSN